MKNQAILNKYENMLVNECLHNEKQLRELIKASFSRCDTTLNALFLTDDVFKILDVVEGS